MAECVEDSVSGPDNSLEMTECGSMPAIKMMPTASQKVSIGFRDEAISSDQGVMAIVTGEAQTSATAVAVQVKYFDAVGEVLGTDQQVVHKNAAGTFSAIATFGNVPQGAVTYDAAVVPAFAGLLLYYLLVSSTGDDDDLEDCSTECDDGSIAYGVTSIGGGCDAVCFET